MSDDANQVDWTNSVFDKNIWMQRPSFKELLAQSEVCKLANQLLQAHAHGKLNGMHGMEIGAMQMLVTVKLPSKDHYWLAWRYFGLYKEPGANMSPFFDINVRQVIDGYFHRTGIADGFSPDLLDIANDLDRLFAAARADGIDILTLSW